MTLGLRPLEARQPGPLLMRQVVASFLCRFHEEVDRTVAITCRAHIDEARPVVEDLQLSALSGASLRSTAAPTAPATLAREGEAQVHPQAWYFEECRQSGDPYANAG